MIHCTFFFLKDISTNRIMLENKKIESVNICIKGICLIFNEYSQCKLFQLILKRNEINIKFVFLFQSNTYTTQVTSCSRR